MEEIPLLFIVFKGTVPSGVSIVLIYVLSIVDQGHKLDYLENHGKLRLVEWYVLVRGLNGDWLLFICRGCKIVASTSFCMRLNLPLSRILKYMFLE